MKKLSKIELNLNQILRKDELLNLKGGGDGEYCCTAYTNGWAGYNDGHASFCWFDSSLTDEWCGIYQSLGYHTTCNYSYA